MGQKCVFVRMTHLHATLPSLGEVRIRPQEAHSRGVGLWGRHAFPSACIRTQRYLRSERFGYDRRKLIREGSVCGADMRFRTHAFARNATFARRGSDTTAGSSLEEGRSVGRTCVSVRMHLHAALPSFEEVRIRPQEAHSRGVGLWGRHAFPSACICTQPCIRLKRFGSVDRRKLIREGSVCGVGMHAFRNPTV